MCCLQRRYCDTKRTGGFYTSKRDPGDEETIDSKTQTSHWMLGNYQIKWNQDMEILDLEIWKRDFLERQAPI